MHEPSDEQLVHRALEYPNQFGLLMSRYEPRLMRYIKRITNVSYEEAEDILQEVFLRTYKSLHDFDTTLSFSSWIYRITHNYVRSHFRKARARPQTVVIDTEIMENIAGEVDLDLSIDQDMLKQTISRALSKMDKKYKEVLVLKFLEEKSYQEMSDILQKPMGSIATLMNRAKKQLKKYI
jgi:RNA polymerase sigma-70 factor, ECF subfamily